MKPIWLALCLSTAVVGSAALVLAEDAPEAQRAARILAASGRTKGICLDLGCGDGKLSAALVAQSEFYVHAIEAGEARAAAARKVLEATGLYAERCAVSGGSLERIPFPDYCANLVVCGDGFAEGFRGREAQEILRVLQPGGLAYLGQPAGGTLTPAKLKSWLAAGGAEDFEALEAGGVWALVRRKRPAGMGDWSHGLDATPGNYKVVDDLLVKAPFHTAWIGGPQKFTKFGVICASEGRFLLRHGGITHTGRWKSSGEPDAVQCLDGWNGIELWKARLREADGDGLVAACGVVLAHNGTRLSCLDARDGTDLWHKTPAEADPEGKAWAWYGCDRDFVVAALLDTPRLYASKTPQPAKILAGFEARSGARRWSFKMEEGLCGVALGEGRVHAAGLNGRVVTLDIADGKEIWSAEWKKPERLSLYRGALYSKHEVLDAATGKPLPGKPAAGWLAGERIVKGGIGGVSVTEPGGTQRTIEARVDPFSPKTAVPKGGLYGRCIPSTATPHCYFFSYSGTVIADLEGGKLFPTESFRANCRTGVIAGNGLVYNSPSGCGCTFVIRGGAALVPVDEALYEAKPESNPPPQLVKGPAYGQSVETPPDDGEAWPAYRANAARDCSARTALAFPLKHAWTVKLGEPVTQAVVGAERVFTGSRNHAVIALHARSGEPAWRYPTGGAVSAPPAYWNGRVYAGCQDGWLYCLRATDGALIWRFRGAPHERNVILHGKPASLWPMAGGAIAEDGKVWCYAGRCAHDKVYVHCLDAETGEIVWTNGRSGLAVDLTGPEGGVSPHGVSPSGLLAASKEVLFVPQGPRWPAGFRKSDGKLLWWNKRGDSTERSNMNIQHLGGAELSCGGGLLFMGGSNELSGHDQFFCALDASNGRIWGQDDPRFFDKVMRREDGTTIMPQNYKWGIQPIKFGKGMAPVVCGDGLFVFNHYPGCYDLKKKLDSQFEQDVAGARRWGIPGGALVISGQHAVFGGANNLEIRRLADGALVASEAHAFAGTIRPDGLAAAHKRLYAVTTENEIGCWAP